MRQRQHVEAFKKKKARQEAEKKKEKKEVPLFEPYEPFSVDSEVGSAISNDIDITDIAAEVLTKGSDLKPDTPDIGNVSAPVCDDDETHQHPKIEEAPIVIENVPKFDVWEETKADVEDKRYAKEKIEVAKNIAERKERIRQKMDEIDQRVNAIRNSKESEESESLEDMNVSIPTSETPQPGKEVAPSKPDQTLFQKIGVNTLRQQFIEATRRESAAVTIQKNARRFLAVRSYVRLLNTLYAKYRNYPKIPQTAEFVMEDIDDEELIKLASPQKEKELALSIAETMTPDEYSVVNLLMREKLEIYNEDDQIDTESASEQAYSDDFEVESMHRSPSFDFSKGKQIHSPDRTRELELEVAKYKYQYETQKEANRDLIIKQAHITHTQIEQQLAQVQKELATTSNPARIQQLVAQMQTLVSQAKNSLTTGLQIQEPVSALDSPSIARVRSGTSSISEDLRTPTEKPAGIYDKYKSPRVGDDIEEDIYSEDFQSESQSIRSPSPVRSIQSSIYDDDFDSESKVSVGRPKMSLTRSSEISEEISGTMGSGTLSGVQKKGIRILDKDSESGEISEEISSMMGSHAFSTKQRQMGSMGSIGEELVGEKSSRSKSSGISEEINTISYPSPSKESEISDYGSVSESIKQDSTLSPSNDSKYDVNTLSSYSRSRPIKASGTISEDIADDYSEDFESESGAQKLSTLSRSRQMKQSGTISESIDEDYSQDFETDSQSKIMESMVSRKSGRFIMQSGEITEDIAGESAAYSEDFESESQMKTVSGRQSGYHGSSIMEVSEAIPSEYSDDFESQQSQSQAGLLVPGRKVDLGSSQASVAFEISEAIPSEYSEDFESMSQSQVAALVSGRKLDVGSSQASVAFEISEAIPSDYSEDFESMSQSQVGALISGRKLDVGSSQASVAFEISENIPSEYTDDYESESLAKPLSSGRKSIHQGSPEASASVVSEYIAPSDYSEDFESDSHVASLSRRSGYHGDSIKIRDQMGQSLGASDYSEDFESESQPGTLTGQFKNTARSGSEVSEEIYGESFGDTFGASSSQQITLKTLESDIKHASSKPESSYADDFESESNRLSESPNRLADVISEQSPSPAKQQSDDDYISEEIDTYEDYEDDFEAESVASGSVRRSQEDILLQSASSYRSEEDMEAQSGDIEWVITLGKKDSPRNQMRQKMADDVVASIQDMFVKELTQFLESKRKPVEAKPLPPPAEPEKPVETAPTSESEAEKPADPAPETPQAEPAKPVVTKKKVTKKGKKAAKKKLEPVSELPSLAPLKPGGLAGLPGLKKGPGLSRPSTPARTAYEKAADFIKLLLENANISEILTRLQTPKSYDKVNMMDHLGKLDTMREVRLDYEPPIPESVFTAAEKKCPSEDSTDMFSASAFTQADTSAKEKQERRLVYDMSNEVLADHFFNPGTKYPWEVQSLAPKTKADLEKIITEKLKAWFDIQAGKMPKRNERITEENLKKIREEKLKQILASDIGDSAKTVNARNSEIQLKIHMAEIVFNHLVEETVQILERVNNK